MIVLEGKDNARDTLARESDKPSRVCWAARAGRQKGRGGLMSLGAIIILASFCAGWALEGALWGWLSLLFLLLANGRYFTPSRYRMDEDGVSVVWGPFRSDKPWSHYKRWGADRNAAFLSPYATPKALESFRGATLYFADNRERVVALIETHMGPPVGEARRNRS